MLLISTVTLYDRSDRKKGEDIIGLTKDNLSFVVEKSFREIDWLLALIRRMISAINRYTIVIDNDNCDPL